MTMGIRLKCFILVLFILTCTVAEPCKGQSGLVIHPKTNMIVELQGYDGFEIILIYRGALVAGEDTIVETAYNGLAMLIFSGKQKYPVIIGRKTSGVVITSPDKPPSFECGDENNLFYKSLSGNESADKGNGFARLMIHGKVLLDSSSTIQTVEELHGKKVEFQEFMQSNYLQLSHSDLLRRLLNQYFMMHEYVRFHREGSPAGDIRLRYQQEVLAGVKSMVTILKDFIPENEVLNYCIGLYYHRGMVTLASFIANNFRKIAYCGGENPVLSDFPANLKLITSDGSAAVELGALKGSKTFSFVSSDCPVSMVMTVMKVRKTVEVKNHKINRYIIVVPLEKLSAKHRAMSKNVSGGAMFFVDDEVWRKKNLPKNIRLPFFGNIATPKG